MDSSMEASNLKTIIDRIAEYISVLKKHFEKDYINTKMMYFFRIRDSFILENTIDESAIRLLATLCQKKGQKTI